MLIPIPIFIPQFPYVKFEKKYSPNEYKRIKINEFDSDPNHIYLIKINKELLSLNQIPLNKIRFVFLPSFTYDVDNNIINPQYDIMIPLRRDGSGLFNHKLPLIEIGKPKNLITIFVDNYKFDDNFEFIKQTCKKSKRGVVIFLADDAPYVNKPYHFYVDDEVIRMVNLDDAVGKWKIENN